MRGLPLLALALLLLSMAPAAEAAPAGALGVTPTALVIPDGQPDQVYQRRVMIQNQMDEASTITITPGGDIAPWTTVTPSTFSLPAHTNRWVDVTMATPAGAFGGRQQGLLHVVTESKGVPDGSGMGVRWSVLVKLDVTLSGPPRPSVILQNVQTEDVEVGTPPFLRTRISNDGNVATSTTLIIQILSADGSTVLMTLERTINLQPGEDLDLPLSLEGTLPEGRYIMSIRGAGRDGAEERRDFSVVGPGQLGKQGALRFLIHESVVDPDALVQVVGVFDNVGQATIVRPRLVAEVLYGGKTVAVLEAEGLIQPHGQRQNLTGYFTPRQPGEYTILGTVVYDGVESNRVESLLNVRAPPDEGWTLRGLGDSFLGALGGATGGTIPPMLGLGMLGLTGAVVLLSVLLRRRKPPAAP